ncbi:MAG: YhcB family protein [Thermoflavifilum sp.]|nr:YhcB family protein [Thermoflavifilum sp.]
MDKRIKESSAFVLGLAVGVIVGYFLRSEKVDEVVQEIKGKLNKWRADLEGELDKGADWLKEMTASEEA